MKYIKLFAYSIILTGLVGCSTKYEMPASVSAATVKFKHISQGYEPTYHIQVAKNGCFTTQVLGDFQKKASLDSSMAKVPANTPIALIASYKSYNEQCEVAYPVILEANKTYTMTMIVASQKCLLLLSDESKSVSRLKLKAKPTNRYELCKS